jgi:enterochelin esterase-like enzyme/outer membrane protein assembly factor BamB
MHRRPALRARSATALAFALGLAPALGAPGPAAADWPQQRGPSQNATVDGTGLLSDGGFGLEVAWKRALGSGYSEIAVVGDLAVTMFTDGTNDLVAAFDAATGEERWRYTVGPMYAGHDGSDDGPIGTPTIADGVVYGINAHGRFFALRLADGGELWARGLDVESEAQAPVYGFATVPVVAGDALVVLTGRQEGGRAITAYRRSDGTPLWSRGEDTVAYQSPIVAEVGARRQLVAATNHLLLGLDPASGEILWQHRHTPERGDGFAQPVALGGNRFLVNLGPETAAYEVVAVDGGHEVRELWRTNSLRDAYSVPVLHEGHLYGFAGRFLTCVDAATGEVVWRSRPPGGNGVLLLDGHLVIVSADGDLVIAEASPAGYHEKARLEVFERPGLTPVSFAGGRLYARNLEEMASLAVTATPTAASRAAVPAPPDFSGVPGPVGEALRGIAATEAARKPALVAALLAAHPTLPAIDSDGTVHFLYRGDAEDVGVLGSMMDFNDERALDRVPGTDLYHASMQLDPEGHWQYALRVDFGDPAPDPGNPYPIVSPFGGEGSELRMPGWPVPAHIDEPPAHRPRGRIEEHAFASEIRGDERQIQVYLPPGYDEGEARYPVFYLNSGDQELNLGKLGNTLDNLIGERVAPVIAVLIPRSGDYMGPDRAAYARMTVEELVPFVDRTYRTDPRPEARAVGGVGSAGYAAVYAAFHHPGVFGKVSVQSFYMLEGTDEEVLAAIGKAAGHPIIVFVEASRNDYVIPQVSIDAPADTRRLREALAAAGFEVILDETAGAPGWGHWRSRNDRILTAFFPAADGG